MAFRYRKTGKHLICIDQSLISAIKALCINYSAHELHSLNFSRQNGMSALKTILRHKMLPRETDEVITLPVFGNIGIKVHHGVKVFDLERSEVSKVFESSFSREGMREEVEASRIASAVAAAPRHIMADSDFSWLRESYIAGRNAARLMRAGSSDYLSYYQDVEDCLLDLVGCHEPVTVSLSAHLNGLTTIPFLKSWSAAGMAGRDIDKIQLYRGELKDWLVNESRQDDLQLVLTHGDFSLVNAIKTNRGLRFIDWEGIGFGGLYSDLFNFVFVERYYERSSERFSAELNTYLQTYRHTVRSRFPTLQDAASLDLVFARRLYYLERISLLLEREVSPKLCEVVLKSIELFSKFDIEAGDIESSTDKSAAQQAQ